VTRTWLALGAVSLAFALAIACRSSAPVPGATSDRAVDTRAVRPAATGTDTLGSGAIDEMTKLAVQLEADADIGKDRLEACRAAARAWGAVLRVDAKASTATEALRRIAAKPEVAARRAELERAIVEAAGAGNSSAAALLLAELREWEPGAADLKALPETGIVARPAGRAGE